MTTYRLKISSTVSEWKKNSKVDQNSILRSLEASLRWRGVLNMIQPCRHLTGQKWKNKKNRKPCLSCHFAYGTLLLERFGHITTILSWLSFLFQAKTLFIFSSNDWRNASSKAPVTIFSIQGGSGTIWSVHQWKIKVQMASEMRYLSCNYYSNTSELETMNSRRKLARFCTKFWN